MRSVFVLLLAVTVINACDNSSDMSSCGNGIIDIGEDCDGDEILNGSECVNHGYNSGSVFCRSDCTVDLSECIDSGKCGNGEIEGEEDCDGDELDNETCNTLGYIQGGTLNCSDECKFDYTGCTGYDKCGNGILDEGEECDGNEIPTGTDCTDYGYFSGTVFCSQTCTLNLSECAGSENCGNGEIDEGEDCDGEYLGGKDCTSYGYIGGNLHCLNCSFDFSGCSECGNTIVEAGEECDGNNFDGPSTCTELGYFNPGTSSSVTCNECIVEANCSNTILFGSDLEDEVWAMGVDSIGNIYVGGNTPGDLDGNINQGENDLFLAKFSNTGEKLWIKQWGNSENQYLRDLVVNADDTVTVVGITKGNLDDQINAGDDSSDVFISRISETADILWTRMWGSNTTEDVYSMYMDADGNYYVAGSTYGEMPGFNSFGGTDGFLTKWAPDGTFNWTVQFGTATSDNMYGVTGDTSGNIYVTGMGRDGYEGSVFGGDRDIHLLKFDSNGTELWKKSWGGTGYDLGRDMVCDSEGNIYLTGMTDGTLISTPEGDFDSFLYKLDPDGDEIWSRRWGTPAYDRVYKIIPSDVSYVEGVVITGYTESQLGTTYNGMQDAYTMSYTTNGDTGSIIQFGTEMDDSLRDIFWDENSNCFYLTGITDGNLDGNTNMTHGSADIFISRICE
ncbi:MAG: SBBP repeat-containing protein [Deltaproteobacteria bacterium]|nr:SBBP repeat-containing protein [Deltaproteobacteria bacterium]